MFSFDKYADNPLLVGITLCAAIAASIAVTILFRRTVKRVGGRPIVVAASVLLAIVLHLGFFWLLPSPPRFASNTNPGPADRAGGPVEFHFSDHADTAESNPIDSALPPLPLAAIEATRKEAPAENEVRSTALPLPMNKQLDLADDAPLAGIDEVTPLPLDALWATADEVTRTAPTDEADQENEPVPSESTVPAKASPTAGETLVEAPRQNRWPVRLLHRDPRRRSEIAKQRGGDAATEAAVEHALVWLAANQRGDGMWDARQSGGGRAASGQGATRDAAGASADTGITGLALLAMLGAGYIPSDGPHAATIDRGLQALIRIQRPDGSLAGNAGYYAATYCHGIAALALAEAAAMDPAPQRTAAARAALAYSIRSQSRATGGWRYRPGDPGDLSQHGWQALALESGKLAGIAVPQETERGLQRFLQSVRGGRYGGLARYRPGEATSPTMTAEALATRLLLGLPLTEPEIREAEHELLTNLPERGAVNIYYWYYASLALHQLNRPSWHTWNASMKRQLKSLQLPGGNWPTDTVWGSYGGSVYTTALGCLCLEVYYRHLSIHDFRLAESEASQTR